MGDLSKRGYLMGEYCLEPEDIADAVAFLVSDQAKWITGWRCRWTRGSACDDTFLDAASAKVILA